MSQEFAKQAAIAQLTRTKDPSLRVSKQLHKLTKDPAIRVSRQLHRLTRDPSIHLSRQLDKLANPRTRAL